MLYFVQECDFILANHKVFPYPSQFENKDENSQSVFQPSRKTAWKCVSILLSYYSYYSDCLYFWAPNSQELNILHNNKFTSAINLKTLKCHSIALYLIYAYEISTSAFGSSFLLVMH